MNAKYVIASKKNRTIRSFDKADSVASFMLGRNFSEWSIYQRQDDLYVGNADVMQVQKMLEAREALKPSATEGGSAIGPRDSL